MKLREVLTLDVETLSPAQAHQVAQDTIAALANGVIASDQPKLKSLLIAAQEIATGRKVGAGPLEYKTGAEPRCQNINKTFYVKI